MANQNGGIMNEYHCRKGTAQNKRQLKDYNELLNLPYRQIDDDGRMVPCGTEPWPVDIICPDCRRQAVVHAEACFTPGHRICPGCGSHWSLESPSQDGQFGGEWFLQRARFYVCF